MIKSCKGEPFKYYILKIVVATVTNNYNWRIRIIISYRNQMFEFIK